MDKYFVYSKSDCKFCDATEKLLSELKDQGHIEYETVKVEDRDERNKLYDEYKLTGRKRTMPMIFIELDGEKNLIGGYTENAENIRGLYS